MPIAFERPVGAKRDVKELEFISSLMQTDLKTIRLDGSIKAYDIVQYLKSRHGVDTDEETVKRLILQELAGSTEAEIRDNEEIVLDLCQFASLMLIPELVEALSNKELEAKLYTSTVLRDMISNAHGGELPLEDSSILWTPAVLRHLFNRYNELDVSDELIDEMILVAGTDGDERECTIRALTGDLGKFDIGWKNKLSINYYDALGGRKANKSLDDENDKTDPDKALTTDSIRRRANEQDMSEQPYKPSNNKKKKKKHPLKRVFTAPNIDFYADTFRRPVFVTAVWVCGVCLYFAYVWGHVEGGTNWSQVNCADFSVVGCPIINGITKWLAIFIQLTMLGFPFIYLGTLGASVYVQHWLGTVARMLVGMTVILCWAIIPFYRTFTTRFYDTSGNKGGENDAKRSFYDPAFYISVILGFLLFFSRALDLLFVILPKRWLGKRGVIQKLITPGGIQTESRMKRGASYKTVQMIDNALALRPENRTVEESSSLRRSNRRSMTSSHTKSSSTEKALMNYQLDLSVKEQVGGIFWAWKRILTGKIYSEEGIWLHGRLWSCNMSQFVIVFFVIFFASIAYKFSHTFDKAPQVEKLLEDPTSIIETTVSALQSSLDEIPELVGNQTMNFTEGLETLLEYQGYFGFSDTVVYAYGMYIFNETVNNVATDFQLNETLVDLLDMNINSTQIAALSSAAYLFYYQDVAQVPITLSDAFQYLDELRTNYDLDQMAYDYFQSGLLSAFALNYVNLDWMVQWELAEDITVDEGLNVAAILVEFANAVGFTKSDYLLAITVAFFCGLGASGYVALSYVPSYISQTLKFRSGVIPSLDDRDFLKNRYALDSIAVLFGSAFWSCLFSSLVAGLIFGLIMAICLIDWGGNMGASIGGLILGFAIVFIIKMLVLKVCRSLFFEALYRKRPAGANFMGLMVEVWNVALAVGIVFMRVLIILLISTFFIARLDTEFLAPGVGQVGPMELDSYPRVFRKDLVVHEAHRHPYIERFGLLCLLKLRHGADFGSRPHACWRLFYALTLMPWLRKYRVGFLVNDDDDDDKNNDISTMIKSSEQRVGGTPSQWVMKSGSSVDSSNESTELKFLKEIDALKSRNRELEAALTGLQGKKAGRGLRRGASRRAAKEAKPQINQVAGGDTREDEPSGGRSGRGGSGETQMPDGRRTRSCWVGEGTRS